MALPFQYRRGDTDPPREEYQLAQLAFSGNFLDPITGYSNPGLQEAVDLGAAYSPDGRSVVTTRSRRPYDPQTNGRAELFIRPAGPGEPRQITSDGGRAPDWGTNGLIAFTQETGVCDPFCPSTAVFVTSPDGPAVRVASDFTGSPSWSPDGRRLAYAGREWVFLAQPDGSDRRRLTRGTSPVWSPDGKRIAFVRDTSIMTIGRHGRGLRRVAGRCARDKFCAVGIADWRPRIR